MTNLQERKFLFILSSFIQNDRSWSWCLRGVKWPSSPEGKPCSECRAIFGLFLHVQFLWAGPPPGQLGLGDPPNFVQIGIVHEDRRVTVPRETPALNNEGNLNQSRAPPGTATRSTPPYIYSKAALTIKHPQGLITSNRIMDRRFPSVLLKISYPSFWFNYDKFTREKIFIYPFKLKFTLFWSPYFFT